ncbi:hypothetical protein Tco_0424806 [Tanacetum coccineum]
MLWGIVTQTNVDHAELLWEEFTQGFTGHFSTQGSHQASLKAQEEKNPLLIPLWTVFFPRLNKNLFSQERRWMISDLEAAKKMSLDAHQEKGEGEGADADMERAIKLSLDPAFLPQGRAPVGGVTIRDPVSETTPKLPEVVGKGKAIVTEEQVAYSLIDLSKKKRTTDQFILVRLDQATSMNRQLDPPSQPKQLLPKGDKEQGEVDSSTVTSGVSIPVSTQGQAGSDPEKAHEALAGPDPEPMQEDQTGSDSGKLPKVHEKLKLHNRRNVVIEEQSESHSVRENLVVVDESDSPLPDPSHQTVTSTSPVSLPSLIFILQNLLHWSPSTNPTGSYNNPTSPQRSLHSLPSAKSGKIGSMEMSDVKKMITLLMFWLQLNPRNQESEKGLKRVYQNQKGTRLRRTRLTTPISRMKMLDLRMVKDSVKNHKRKHDRDDDMTMIDDEGPSALLSQNDEITDTRDAVVDSSMHRSDPESEHSEQSSDDIPMQDEGHVSDLIKKKLCKADLEGPAFNLVKAFHKNSVFLQFQMDECHKLLTNKVDLVKSLMGCLTRVMKLDHYGKDFICFSSTIKGPRRLGSGQRMTREEAKTSSLRDEKDYSQDSENSVPRRPFHAFYFIGVIRWQSAPASYYIESSRKSDSIVSESKEIINYLLGHISNSCLSFHTTVETSHPKKSTHYPL